MSVEERDSRPVGSPLPGRPESQTNLADILERVLDKGIVIAGDIQINLLDIELLTIKLRLLIASVDRAKEMGINWWEGDSLAAALGPGDNGDQGRLEQENRELRERLERLERALGVGDRSRAMADELAAGPRRAPGAARPRGGRSRRGAARLARRGGVAARPGAGAGTGPRPHPRRARDRRRAVGVLRDPRRRRAPARMGASRGGRVERVQEGELAALVSRVPLAEFGEEPLRRNLNDLAWLERVARAHEDVLEHALAATTIAPLRLCTMYESEERVRAMLDGGARLAPRDPRVARGPPGVGVKLLLDPDLVAEEARARSPEAEVLEASSRERSEGGAYMLRRRLERHVSEVADSLAAEVASHVHARVQDWAVDAVSRPPQNREVSGHEGDMVLNGGLSRRDRAASRACARWSASSRRTTARSARGSS